MQVLPAMATQISLREQLRSFNITTAGTQKHPVVARLQGDLHRERRQCLNYVNKGFLPNNVLNEVLTRQTISDLIISMSNLTLPEQGAELASLVNQIDPIDPKIINHSRKRILAILIAADIPGAIIYFIEAGISDKHLPFEYQGNSGNEQLEYTEENGSRITCPSRCFNNDHNKTYLFGICQWDFIVPSFNFAEGKINHFELPDTASLPFLKGGGAIHIPGGSSQVSQIIIHQSHHDLDNAQHFALKKLVYATNEAFRKETEALKLVRELRHPHLLELLGTFKQGEFYYLIFPWAVDDLKTFWENNPAPASGIDMSTWVLQQCLGIAKGLALIHTGKCSPPGRSGLRGRHGDIKPANILRYAPRAGSPDPKWGILKVSDFGLARFHRDDSYQREYKNGPPATLTYRAPEGDLGLEISCSWDIWSLGCLYLEFLTWLLQGWDGVTAFSEERKKEDQSLYAEVSEDKFFNLSESKIPKAFLKKSISERVDSLHNHPGCTALVHNFLKIISEDLLQIQRTERAECQKIVQKLEDIGRECLENERYDVKRREGVPTRIRRESTKSYSLTGTISSPGNTYNHERKHSEADGPSKQLGLASESGGEENSLLRIKNEKAKRPFLLGLWDSLGSCFYDKTRYLADTGDG